MTPLHLAVQMNQMESVEHLLTIQNEGTVHQLVNSQTYDGKTPLRMLKLLASFKNMMQELIEKGEKIEVDGRSNSKHEKLRELAEELGFSEREKDLLELFRQLEVSGSLELAELDKTTIDSDISNFMDSSELISAESSDL